MRGIVEFLRARLDEDERAARAATPGPWGAQPPEDQSTWDGGWEVVSDAYRPDQLGHQVVNVGDSDPTGIINQRGGVVDEGHARYIARHDPDRVLREIEAKRSILTAHTPTEWPTRAPATCPTCGRWNWEVAMGDDAGTPINYPCPTLRFLAAVYSGHPDYRQEWTP